MTGFGRYEYEDELVKIVVEIKTVNHRYFEPAIKLPKIISMFENQIKNEIKNYVSRGKVDVSVSYEELDEDRTSLKYNPLVAAEYVKIYKQIIKDFDLNEDLSAARIASFPEVISSKTSPIDEEEMWDKIKKAVDKACEQLVNSRVSEGEHLYNDLTEKLDSMLSKIDYIIEREPLVISNYKEKLEAKIREVLQNNMIDDGRIATEVAIFADKVCVDEETVRLKSHITSARNELEKSEGVGRKLDFIAQEMNREANTILSKASDLDITNLAIEIKTEVEKVREQIQNIE